MITSHKCISAYINKDTLYAFQEKSESEILLQRWKKKKRSREVFSVLLWGSNLWHLKLEICTSHPDSHGESGYRQVLFPPVGKKKTTSLPSDFKKCCHFLHSIFKGREIPFNTCHPRKATILLFVIRTAAFFSPRLFAGDNLSLSRAFDVSVERNITSDFSIAFSLLKLYHLITDF